MDPSLVSRGENEETRNQSVESSALASPENLSANHPRRSCKSLDMKTNPVMGFCDIKLLSCVCDKSFCCRL